MEELETALSGEFKRELVSVEEQKVETKAAIKTQKIDDGIDAQKRVFDVPPAQWTLILREGEKKKFLTPKEIGILKIAEQIPRKIPTEKQSSVLIDVLNKARENGLG